MKKGLFIVLEGIDNCGKTTQAGLLKEYFESLGREVVQTREPGGTQVGEEIREVLLKPREKMPDPVAQTLLFYAARKEFLEEVVKPNLKAGKVVITDRFAASTFVYQGYVQGVDENFINLLHKEIVEKSGCKPDLYVVIDILAEESFKRDKNTDRKDQEMIFEKQGLEFRKKLRAGYLQYAKSHPEVVIIDGSLPPQGCQAKLIKLLLN